MSVLETSLAKVASFLVIAFGLIGCAGGITTTNAVPEVDAPAAQEYIIGPGDTIEIFVWRNADLTRTIPVRPDGRISLPLINDMQAAGKTSTKLGQDIENALAQFVQEPRVTVMVTDFVGPFSAQVRFVGSGVVTQAIPYRENMRMLDAVIAVGGLTEFAAGNRARLSRNVDGETQEFRVRLDDLLNNGDLSANVALLPGDVIFVPESWF